MKLVMKDINLHGSDNCNIKIYWKWELNQENPVFTADALNINVNAIVNQKLGDE